ncbi:hypothetical protein F4821DRAFT_224357 [Hypoxylon rubiginosum]|uniref:Uncharacterized protein n=1 Tax=Hypoxylon rubiginosum TaxID=110542 RepID=A0ACC0DIH4_9PEZI|nr:hypothetical protein F4821DRAFT_224357 [Hypoxylon rubiginosum]
MAPIPVYTNSPIAASKASGVTPKTDLPPSVVSKPATTTASPTSANSGSYPPAQPGAAPSLPTPTATARAYGYDGPPAPQPGAAPTPTSAVNTSIPPPPKAGEKYQPSQQTPAPQPVSMPYPQQMSIPTPTAPYPAQQHGTSTASVPTSYNSQGPTATTGSGFYSLEHPPGYHQNSNASELDRYQRVATHQSELEGQREDTGGGVWDSARKWAQQTGEKLAAAENEVWKKINKE